MSEATAARLTSGHHQGTYKFMRQQGLNPIDACTDAAQFHGITAQELAASLITAGIDAARLSLI